MLSNVFYLGNLCQVIKTFIRVFKKVLPPLGFPGGSEVKASAWNAGDPSSIPGSEKIPWRRQWQPTPVLLPGESHGGRSLVGYSPWGCKESERTERLHFHFHFHCEPSSVAGCWDTEIQGRVPMPKKVPCDGRDKGQHKQ